MLQIITPGGKVYFHEFRMYRVPHNKLAILKSGLVICLLYTTTSWVFHEKSPIREKEPNPWKWRGICEIGEIAEIVVNHPPRLRTVNWARGIVYGPEGPRGGGGGPEGP